MAGVIFTMAIFGWEWVTTNFFSTRETLFLGVGLGSNPNQIVCLFNHSIFRNH